MTIGIYGLGLIGGSMAKAYSAYGGITVYGGNRSKTTLEAALNDGAICGVLDDETIPTCDAIFIGLYPEAAIEYLRSIAPKISKNTLVMDLCGVKSAICREGFAIAEQYGFTFVGGHPMAGREVSGYRYAIPELFRGASFVVVPQDPEDKVLLNRVTNAVGPVGFGRITVTSAEEHDRMIAFTSQLAHVVSNAYIKSPTAQKHLGFSAGSYKDLTRVAYLNEQMWTELFLDNADPLLCELDIIINSLKEYREAIADRDADRLRNLLRDGREAKEKADGIARG